MSDAKIVPDAGRSSTEFALSSVEIFKLKLQIFLGWLFLFPVAILSDLLIRKKFKLKIKNLAEIRKQFGTISKSKRPFIVCSNHLTLVDSVIIMWALAPLKTYFFKYKLFCWNIPAIENYCTKPSWRIFTYLGKCIPIDRTGSREHLNNILEKLSYLVGAGNLCMIFPEGTRSRTGRVDTENVTYGIGKIINNVPGCSVLCVYLRGDHQDSYSDFPYKGDTINLDIELITPTSQHTGLRAIKDYSVQTIAKIKQMEDRYFSSKSCPNTQSEMT